ncbi:MAG: FAD-binding oxidoreductase [Verrucomicrobium sp.]
MRRFHACETCTRSGNGFGAPMTQSGKILSTQKLVILGLMLWPLPTAWGQPLNDVHSRLNLTQVAEVRRPKSAEEVAEFVKEAKAQGWKASIAGARHAMGGQQFGTGAHHLDMTGMNRMLALDADRGIARVEAGITWPVLLQALEAAQPGREDLWTFRQKQTGADVLTLGGAVSANIHGRGLMMKPFVDDIESLTIVDATGELRKLSRELEPEWFSLVVGGYGLFGVVTEMELRLTRRQKVQRIVEIGTVTGLPGRIAERVREGFVLGDFQFSPDTQSPDLLKEGVFSCYRPVTVETSLPGNPAALNPAAWRQLLSWAHSDMAKGWAAYKTHYQRTNGQVYWSDRAQMSHYDTNYEELLEAGLPQLEPGSLMISELYVPRERLEDFLTACAADFREHQTRVIYGTVRFIQKDNVSFLAWARQDFACIVFNLRVTHTEAGKEKAQEDFRRLIDRALQRGGSFFLTYHRWASRAQLLKAYPQFPEFLNKKLKYDPEELFQSDWYRHWKGKLKADESPAPVKP